MKKIICAVLSFIGLLFVTVFTLGLIEEIKKAPGYKGPIRRD